MIASLLKGSAAGIGATMLMSAVMLAAQRAGLMGEHPPERIVEKGAEAAGADPREDEADAVASAAHLAFGAVGGAGFGLLAGLIRPPAVELFAVPWAVGIWLISYLGWIPALGILPPAHEDRPGRAWTMLLAHLVYGASLAALWHVLRGARR